MALPTFGDRYIDRVTNFVSSSCKNCGGWRFQPKTSRVLSKNRTPRPQAILKRNNHTLWNNAGYSLVILSVEKKSER